MARKSVQEEDIRFQLFLRGIELTPEQEEESKTKSKREGKKSNTKRLFNKLCG